MIRAAVFVMLTGLCACQLDAPTTPPNDQPLLSAPENLQKMEAQCVQSGGQMVQGLAGPQCARPETDGGQACTQDSDCSGFCLADSKTCSPESPFFGCHEVLPQAGVKATICID